MLRQFSFFSALLFMAFLSSCVNKTPKEGIADFKTLSNQFVEPAKEYGTAPLYVWNTVITPELIDRTMHDLKEKGFGGVFIHPRPGLITEYKSDEWYKLFGYTVEKGKELGMNVWIYDENSYPSGFAGGHVPAQMPESYNQGQGLVLHRFDVLPEKLDPYAFHMKETDGQLVDISAQLQEEKGKKGRYCLFTKTYEGKSPWFGGYSYVDLLYPGVTEKFIEVTMPGYKQVAGAEFGKTMPGWFTDEPNICPPGGIRWTPDLFVVFKERWGYDLQANLLSLFEETGDWKKVRHNYTQTLLQLFIDRWAKVCHAYCEKHNLKLTGHYWEHGWPDMSQGGDNMAMYAWHQQPAIDMLFNQFDEESPQAQFGNVRSVKELSSVANQMGYKRTLSETYGGGGWEETFCDFKRLGDWEYVLGVNFMNQHLTRLSLAGARKNDYPPTFSEHSPWWNYYKTLNMHYARLSMALSSGEQKNDILILEPTTSIWMYYAYAYGSSYVWNIGKAFQSFVTTLEKAQVEYDLGSENIIKDQGQVLDGKFIVGKRGYSMVVIPPLTENIDAPTFRLLKDFVAGGGQVLSFAQPSFLDGAASEEMKSFFNSALVIKKEALNENMYTKEFASADFRIQMLPGGNMFHHRRMMEDGQLLFLTNSSLTESANGNITMKGQDAIELNTLTGKIHDYAETTNDQSINLDYHLPPAGSLLLYIFDKKQKGFELQPSASIYTKIEAITPMQVKPDEPNVLTIDFCDLQLGNGIYKDIHTFYAADKIFKYHGFENGDPWNTSVQYKDNIVRRDTFSTGGFKVTYRFYIEGDFDLSSMQAVVERPSLYTVTLNGKPIQAESGKHWLDQDMGLFLIGKEVKKGKNLLSIELPSMKIHAEVEPVYILGDFHVKPAAKGWTIEAPAEALTTGSWKSQGWSFYPGTVTYTQKYTINTPEQLHRVRLNTWNGTVASVEVNGKSAGLIFIQPYTLDITEFLQKGENTVQVKVVGSNKNLMGPFHNNPAPGMVGPDNFRKDGGCPSGSDYQQLDYGLMDDFVLEAGM